MTKGIKGVISVLGTEGRFFSAMAVRKAMDPVVKANLIRT